MPDRAASGTCLAFMPNTPPDPRPAGREVLLMMTCLCDAFFAEAAKAAVRVLEHAGCTVHVPADQTCGGQPAFNGGDFENSRKVARHTAAVFVGDLPIIVPSGPARRCTGTGTPARGRHGAGNRIARRAHLGAVRFSRRRSRIERWDGGGHAGSRSTIRATRVAPGPARRWRSCSARSKASRSPSSGKPSNAAGSAAHSVTFPHISGEMGTLKLDHALSGDPDYLVSADLSCLMHLNGLAEAQGRRLQPRHAAEVLWESLAIA
ncbi:MAG: (Fe-S)-binding protein [Verrucomicrobiales bacterium]